MKNPDVVEKVLKTKEKNRINKSKKPIKPKKINSSQVNYWLKRGIK